MLELVGIDHGAHGLHLAVGNVEREHAGHAALRIVGHRAGLAVDQRRHGVGAILLRSAEQPEQEPGDPYRPVHRLDQGQALAAAVADHGHVGSEEVQQAA